MLDDNNLESRGLHPKHLKQITRMKYSGDNLDTIETFRKENTAYTEVHTFGKEIIFKKL